MPKKRTGDEKPLIPGAMIEQDSIQDVEKDAFSSKTKELKLWSHFIHTSPLPNPYKSHEVVVSLLAPTSDNGALGAVVVTGPSPLGTPAHRVFALENHFAPFALVARSAVNIVVVTAEAVPADNIRKSLHPALFVFRVVGIEVDHFAVIETNTETFFNKHIALFLGGKG